MLGSSKEERKTGRQIGIPMLLGGIILTFLGPLVWPPLAIVGIILIMLSLALMWLFGAIW